MRRPLNEGLLSQTSHPSQMKIVGQSSTATKYSGCLVALQLPCIANANAMLTVLTRSPTPFRLCIAYERPRIRPPKEADRGGIQSQPRRIGTRLEDVEEANWCGDFQWEARLRSEEHTSELQSQFHL